MLARRAASGGPASRSRSRGGNSSSKTLPGDVVVFDAPRHSTRRVHDDDGVLAGVEPRPRALRRFVLSLVGATRFTWTAAEAHHRRRAGCQRTEQPRPWT